MESSRIDAQRRAVIAEAISWNKTPYHDRAQIKGVGVTCFTLFAAAFNAVVGSSIVAPNISEQWYMHCKEQLCLEHMATQGFVEIKRDEVRPADIVASNTAFDVYCHSGLLLSWPNPPTAIHVTVRGAEIIRSIWSSWYFTQKPDTHKFFSWGGWH